MSISKGASSRKLDVTLPDGFHSRLVEDLSQLLSCLESDLRAFEAPCFKVSWLRENIFAKFYGDQTSTAEDRRSAAISKWLRMETRNRQTNTRLLIHEVDFGPFSSERLFSTASRFISQIIGRSPPLSSLKGKFTNGASTRVKRHSTAIADKYVGKLHCTSTAWPVFQALQLDDSAYWQAQFNNGICTPEFVESSEMFTVPKTSDIDRVACKEPEINMFLQRAVGDHLRWRLKRHKCNLNDQSRNRDLAREAAFTGKLATIDLSSASDLISTQLVYRLLPLEWVMFLDDLRVKSTMIDGEKHELEMFSSMGNGFTFELESLIFLGLTRAICFLTGTRGSVSIFGDDIIAPVKIAGILSKVFSFCGFKVNMTKSFWKGWFRESCGGHYYGGADVTPFYVREPIRSWPSLILFLNQFRAWACDIDCSLQYFSQDLYRFWREWSLYIPRYLHGGREKGSDFALITPDLPRKRLKRREKSVLANQQGALIQWLHRRSEYSNVLSPSYIGWSHLANWRDLELRLETSTGVTEGDYIVTRNRTWENGIPASMSWYEEI